MFAHLIDGFTGPDDVRWAEAAEPAADGGVIIDVAAAGVSFADLLQTRGGYQLKLPLPFTPGMDAAGVIRSAPAGAGLAAGQRVAVLLSYGCWQEVISTAAERVLPLPPDMNFEAGAAAPLNYLTGLFALVRRGQARAGETLLVHGAAGGVGTAAIGLGRALGLRTIAVVSNEAKREFVLGCGADHAVLSDGWLAAVRKLAGNRAVDIVLDPVGGDRMTDSLRSLAPERAGCWCWASPRARSRWSRSTGCCWATPACWARPRASSSSSSPPSPPSFGSGCSSCGRPGRCPTRRCRPIRSRTPAARCGPSTAAPPWARWC